MVDVSRQSTFPPLLSSPVLSRARLFPLPKCSDQMKSLLDNQKTISDQPKQGKVQTRKPPNVDKSTFQKSSLEILSSKERRQKDYEKAENTLKAWNTLLRQEKDQRYRILQQRVKVQRELIGKNEELSNSLKAKAELERLEKARSLRESRRKYADEQKAHYQRVEEHKRRIARKMHEMEALKESTIDFEHSAIDASAQSKSVEDTVNKKGSQRRGMEVTSDAEQVGEVSPTKSAQEAMIQLLGVETKPIGTVWAGMRTDAMRKISPVVKYSKELKEVASPSIKQCLDIYEQPTARDRFTGKPIPLVDIIEEANETKSHLLSAMNNTLELLTRNAQKKAELMLENKSKCMPSLSCDPGLYVSEDNSHRTLPQLVSKSSKISKDTHSLVPRQCKTSQEVKKKLPSFLTSDGDLVPGSLEELGERLFCTPSKTRRTKVPKHKLHDTGSSVFLTDLGGNGSHLNSTSTSSSTMASELSGVGSRTSMKRSRSQWQPLSTGALTEHRKIKEIEVSGLGHLAHGKYSMWRPATCVVETKESISNNE